MLTDWATAHFVIILVLGFNLKPYTQTGKLYVQDDKNKVWVIPEDDSMSINLDGN